MGIDSAESEALAEVGSDGSPPCPTDACLPPPGNNRKPKTPAASPRKILRNQCRRVVYIESPLCSVLLLQLFTPPIGTIFPPPIGTNFFGNLPPRRLCPAGHALDFLPAPASLQSVRIRFHNFSRPPGSNVRLLGGLSADFRPELLLRRHRPPGRISHQKQIL